MYLTQHFNKGSNFLCSWIFCSLTGFYHKFWVKSRENSVLPWSDHYYFLFSVCAGPTVNNSVTSRAKRYHVNYRTIIGGSEVIAREFPHMVSCRSHLTSFISSNGFFFVFVHSFLPSALLSTFLSLFFLSFCLPLSTLTSPNRRCCPAGSTDYLFPTSPPASRLLISDLPSSITIAYFRPPLQHHDCLIPITSLASRLLISELLSRITIAYFRPPLQHHDCLIPNSPPASRLLTSVLPSSITIA